MWLVNVAFSSFTREVMSVYRHPQGSLVKLARCKDLSVWP